MLGVLRTAARQAKSALRGVRRMSSNIDFATEAKEASKWKVGARAPVAMVLFRLQGGSTFRISALDPQRPSAAALRWAHGAALPLPRGE